MKTFNIGGEYIPASAISSIKPPAPNSGPYNSVWIITLFSNRIFNLRTTDEVVNKDNIIVTNQIAEYFEIPIESDVIKKRSTS